MTRYIVLPTLVVFALGLGAGWALRGGGSTPPPAAVPWPTLTGDVTTSVLIDQPEHGATVSSAMLSYAHAAADRPIAREATAVAPSTRRKRARASRVATYDTLCHRLTLDVNGAVILVPCKTWDKDQDARRP